MSKKRKYLNIGQTPKEKESALESFNKDREMWTEKVMDNTSNNTSILSISTKNDM